MVRRDVAGGWALQVVYGIAGVEGCGRVGWTVRQGACVAAPQIGLDVGFERDDCGQGVVIESPILLGSVNLAQVVNAGVLL